MSSWVDSTDHLLIGIGATAAFLLFITAMTTIAYCIGRRRGLAGILHDPESGALPEPEKGLDEATLKAFPVLLFSKANPEKLLAASVDVDCTGDQNLRFAPALSCSVCLSDYGESEVLRVLPQCGHVFHLGCVDPWLRLHPTCPICRSLTKSAPTSPEACEKTGLPSC